MGSGSWHMGSSFVDESGHAPPMQDNNVASACSNGYGFLIPGSLADVPLGGQ